jgi:methionyl-tRNA formyltransferase
MKLLFAGTPAPAVPVLRHLVAQGHEVVVVLTRPDAVAGRGQRAVISPVAEAAHELDLDVHKPASLRGAEIEAWVAGLDLDVAVVVAYGLLIPRSLLTIPRFGWLNLHFSLLPAWRGAAPVQHAIAHGDDITGACVFQLEEGLDSGPILGHLTEPISPVDTAGSLLARLAEGGAHLMSAVLEALADGTAVASAQPAEGISWAPKIAAIDAHISWVDPAIAIERRVRAYAPQPGAWSMFSGARMKIGEGIRILNETTLSAGDIGVSKNSVRVGTGSTDVELASVKPAGKAWMRAADWGRGLRVSEGVRFE